MIIYVILKKSLEINIVVNGIGVITDKPCIQAFCIKYMTLMSNIIEKDM